MPEQTELSFVGDWRITVSSRDAGWSQRVVASNTAAGTQVLNGVPGMSMDVYGNGQAPWTLRIQHNDGSSGWQPNWLRPISSIAGTRLTWGVSSEDVTTGSSDRDFNDLVINLQQAWVGEPAGPALRDPAADPAGHARRHLRGLARPLLHGRARHQHLDPHLAGGCARWVERPLPRVARGRGRSRGRCLVNRGRGGVRTAGHWRPGCGGSAAGLGIAADLLQGGRVRGGHP